MTAPIAATDALDRLGLFGGSFDPVHSGHIAAAKAAVVQLELDALWFIPTARSPFKSQPQASNTHRLAMLELATRDIPKTRIDTRELTRTGTSYTIDTLSNIQQQYPATTLFLILGQDAWAGFKQWHRWRAILELADIAVLNRADAATPADLQQADARHARAQKTDSQISAELAYTPLDMPPNTASSTGIRKRIRAQQPLDGLVPDPISDYIQQHRLYAE